MNKRDLGILLLFFGIVLLVGGAYWLVVAEEPPEWGSVPVPYVVIGVGIISLIQGIIFRFSSKK